MTRYVVCAIVALASGVVALPAAGQTTDSSAACAALVSHRLTAGRVIAARTVDAGAFGVPGAGGSDTSAFATLPVFCRVQLVLAPSADSEIGVEVWLPRSAWNGRFQGVGNRGWGGAINYALLSEALAAGYAAASTDTGHQGPGAAFALGHPEKVVDAGYRAVHGMTVAAKQLIMAFYGRPPGHSYWNGCSLGGRQGLAEAQRYPDDYDGIVAGAPASNLTSLYAARLAMARTVHRSAGSYIPPAKYPAIHGAVLAACDGRDGVRDGVLEDPRACRFDPRAIQCQAGEDRGTCLTADQVETARAMYADIRDPAGEVVLSAGLAPGVERRWNVIAGPEPEDNALDLFRYVVRGDAQWDWRGEDFAAAVPQARAVAGPVLDAVDPDLSRFVDRGGKLLMYHGWSDPQTPPANTIAYYRAVAERLGGDRAASVRLFMAPGVGHCSGGDGPDIFDKVGPLATWVETGVAPARIETSLVRNGKTVRTRPLCPFDSVAVWNGNGDTDVASNFSCVAASAVSSAEPQR